MNKYKKNVKSYCDALYELLIVLLCGGASTRYVCIYIFSARALYFSARS
jgi:hypothetical protein